jgi:hypothetical protein
MVVKPAIAAFSVLAFCCAVPSAFAQDEKEDAAAATALQEPVKPEPQPAQVEAVKEQAQPVQQKIEETTEMKEVEGTINAKSFTFLALGVGANSEGTQVEMAFNVDKDVKIVHKKSYKELRAGDIVRVRYAEMKQVDASGKTIGSSRMLKQITFLKSAEKKQSAPAALASQEEGQGSIPLKGMKGE